MAQASGVTALEFVLSASPPPPTATNAQQRNDTVGCVTAAFDAPQTPELSFNLGSGPEVPSKSPAGTAPSSSGHGHASRAQATRHGRAGTRQRGTPTATFNSNHGKQATAAPKNTPGLPGVAAASLAAERCPVSLGTNLFPAFRQASETQPILTSPGLPEESGSTTGATWQPQQRPQPQFDMTSGTHHSQAPVPAAPGEDFDALSHLIGLLLLPEDQPGADAPDAVLAVNGGAGARTATGLGAGADGGGGGGSGAAAFTHDRSLATGAATHVPGNEWPTPAGSRLGPGCTDAERRGEEGGGALDLHALAAALDEVDASLDGWAAGAPPAGLLGPLAREDDGRSEDDDDEDHDDVGPTGPGLGPQQPQQPSDGALGPSHRRARKAVRRSAGRAGQHRDASILSGSPGGTVSPKGMSHSQASGLFRDGAVAAAARPAAAAVEGGGWQLMVSAPSPHNPEALATLLIAGRLVKPQTAVPAPLLAEAVAAAAAAAAATTAPPAHRTSWHPIMKQDGTAAPQAPGGGQGREAGLGRAVEGPAVALVRCGSDHDAGAALALAGKRLYCPPLVAGGRASWRPITVIVQSGPGAGAGVPPVPSAPEQQTQSRVREAGPSVRRVVLSGLPGHLDGDDLTALFGSGLQLPGHAARPQDRRFLLLCPDAISFNSLLSWSGTRLPDKPLDALRQIVPRVANWTALRVEEDDGVHLPALISELRAAARLVGLPENAGPRPPGPRPRVVGRFHPADLDAMDELDAEGGEGAEAEAGAGPDDEAGQDAAPGRSGSVRDQGSVVSSTSTAPAGAGGATHHREGAHLSVWPPRPAAPASQAAGRGPTNAPRRDADDAAAAAAAAAERAESSRGASSSGLAARPAPRPRRGGGGGQFAASVGAGGGFFFGPGDHAGRTAAGAAADASCPCCPPPTLADSGVRGMGFPRAVPEGGTAGGGGSGESASSWSDAAAIDMLKKLFSLGIDSRLVEEDRPEGQEEERAPFFRRSRKRMPVHFGRRPEDEDEGEGEDGEEEGREEEDREEGVKVEEVAPEEEAAGGSAGGSTASGSGRASAPPSGQTGGRPSNLAAAGVAAATEGGGKGAEEGEPGPGGGAVTQRRGGSVSGS